MKDRKQKKGRREQKRKCQVEQCALKKFKGVCGGAVQGVPWGWFFLVGGGQGGSLHRDELSLRLENEKAASMGYEPAKKRLKMLNIAQGGSLWGLFR